MKLAERAWTRSFSCLTLLFGLGACSLTHRGSNDGAASPDTSDVAMDTVEENNLDIVDVSPDMITIDTPDVGVDTPDVGLDVPEVGMDVRDVPIDIPADVPADVPVDVPADVPDDAGPTTLWSVDFTVFPRGSLTMMPTTLNYVRAGSASVQISSTNVTVGISPNVARIGQRTDSNTTRGLVIEEARTNFAPSTRTLGGTGWSMATCTVTPNFAQAADVAVIDPTFTMEADEVRCASMGAYSSYLTLPALTMIPHVASIWVRSGTAASVPFRMQVGHSGVDMSPMQSATVDWSRVIVPSATMSSAFTPIASTMNNSVYYADLVQLESGRFATEYIDNTTASPVTRAGDRLAMNNFPSLLSNGRLRLEFELIPKGDSSQYNYPITLLYYDDNYSIRLTSARDMVIRVNGTNFSSNDVPSWNAFDNVRFFIETGNGANSGRVKVNGATANLNFSGANSAAFPSIPGAGVQMLNENGGSQFTSWVRRIAAYSATAPTPF